MRSDPGGAVAPSAGGHARSERRRVVVTGMGAMSPLGCTLDEIWSRVTRGESGVGPITLFDAAGHKTRFAAEVKAFDPEQFMDRREARHLDRFMQFALAAAALALRDAQLEIGPENAPRVGCVIGNCMGGVATFEREVALIRGQGPARVDPFFILKLIPDLAAGHVAMRFGLKGLNYATASSCASAAHAIGNSLRHIQAGEADAMICGGAEATITATAVAGFNALRALSTRNDDYVHASCPFDKTRDGFVVGEGAGIVVLESLESARRRDAPIWAELVGYGASNDTYHITAPPQDGDGFARSMSLALEDARLRPTDISYVNAHGTSTRLNDAAETQALKRVFGEHAGAMLISSTKSMTGHLIGASAAVELIISVLSLRGAFAPPTVNYRVPDQDCDLSYCPNVGVASEMTAVMSNSFGFGGHNASLIAAPHVGMVRDFSLKGECPS